MSNEAALVQQLDSFDPQVRKQALQALADLQLPTPPAVDNLNLHFHSFFSYNAEGWSPSHIAWEASRAGLYAAGLCDFDVLDGLEEFLQAGELLALRATANLETRVYVKELAEVDISSPGEPGVTYIMGAGFARPLDPAAAQGRSLQAYRDGARERNLALVERINAQLPAIAIDYAADVLPLTPAGAATERHIIRAYVEQAAAVCGTPAATAQFWADLLGKAVADMQSRLGTPALEEMARSKLAKRGGLGYVQPSVTTFPPVDDFTAWILSCRAIPMITWLDGTSGGEADARGSLELMMSKGCAALNIVPERNWNLQDPVEKATKIANLQAIVTAADDLGLPLNIGTEMNRGGLPFVDDLAGPVLSHFRASFRRGARIMVGHTLCLRYADLSYTDPGLDLAEKNHFFESVGALPPLNAEVAQKLAADVTTARTIIEQSAIAGKWLA